MSDKYEPIALALKHQTISVPGKIPRQTVTEWSVLGFTTANELYVKKAKSALVLHENVSGLHSVMRSLKELRTVAARTLIEKDPALQNIKAKALHEKIECFRAELFHDYLDLVTDPEFLIAAVKLGDRVSISNHSLNEYSE